MLTDEEKKERIKKQKLDWYHNNKDKVAKARKAKYSNLDISVEPVRLMPVLSTAPIKGKLQEKGNIKSYSYLDFVNNQGFRPEAQRFQEKASIYRNKYNEDQQAGSRDLNYVAIKEPLSDKINKPLGLRKTIKATPMPWSKAGHSFASDYQFRDI